MRAAVWNTRAALLYSLGGWTMLGAMIHYSRTSGGDIAGGGQPENESDPQAQQGPRQEVFVTDTAFGLRVTTTITYREVQPPITRLLRRVKSFFYPNDVPPSEN
ncbi:hypothetical protein Q9966_008513 [Columba livia]|nr:hypothetical protein Q9966_008513 [Columba livia]